MQLQTLEYLKGLVMAKIDALHKETFEGNLIDLTAFCEGQGRRLAKLEEVLKEVQFLRDGGSHDGFRIEEALDIPIGGGGGEYGMFGKPNF